MVAWKDIPVAEREQFKARTKEQIAEIEAWMLSSPNRPIYLQVGNSPAFAFRRFTNEEYLAIQARLPKSEAEALELSKDPGRNRAEADAEISDLEACCLDPIRREAWVGMDWRDRTALWAELLKIAQQREENVIKFRENQSREDDGENLLPLPTQTPLPSGPGTA